MPVWTRRRWSGRHGRLDGPERPERVYHTAPRLHGGPGLAGTGPHLDHRLGEPDDAMVEADAEPEIHILARRETGPESAHAIQHLAPHDHARRRDGIPEHDVRARQVAGGAIAGHARGSGSAGLRDGRPVRIAEGRRPLAREQAHLAGNLAWHPEIVRVRKATSSPCDASMPALRAGGRTAVLAAQQRARTSRIPAR